MTTTKLKPLFISSLPFKMGDFDEKLKFYFKIEWFKKNKDLVGAKNIEIIRDKDSSYLVMELNLSSN